MATIFDLLSGWSFQNLGLILNGVWVGLIVTVLVWLALRKNLALPASGRYLVWWATLLTVVALPWISAPWSDDWSLLPLPTTAQETGLANYSLAPLGSDRVAEKNPTVSGARSPSAQPDPYIVTGKARIGTSFWDSVPLRTFPLVLAGAWLSFFLVGLCRLWGTYRGIVRIKNLSRPFELTRMPNLQQRLESAAGRNIAVRLSAEIDAPMAAGLGSAMILIPEKVADALSPDDLEVIILHELAHLNRWDDWAKLVQKLVEAVFFFHPAIHLIVRQLELERELACDEWAVSQSGQVEHYARSLTRLVQLTNGGITTLMPGALTGRKQIFHRFERLLLYLPTVSFRRTRLVTAALTVAVLGSALLLAGIAPAVTLPFKPLTLAELVSTPSGTSRPDQSNRSDTPPRPTRVIGTGRVADDGTVYGATVSTNDKTITTTYIDDTVSISAEQEGDLELSPDGRRLVNLAPDARFTFEVKLRKDHYQLTAAPGENGKPEYNYYRNDKLQTFDQDAQDWFGDMFAFFSSETGFAARGRLRKFLQDGGLDSALSFIAEELSPHARRYYYEQLLEVDDFSKSDLRRIADHADEVLTDDYDRDYIFEMIDDQIDEGDKASSRRSSTSIYRNDDAESLNLTSSSSRTTSSTTVFTTSTDTVRDLDSVLATLNLSPKVVLDADWEAEFKRGRPWLQFTFYYDRRSQSSFSLPLEDFTGVDETWRTERVDDVRFLLVRGAGVFDFRGGFKRGIGEGEFEFRVNEDYLRELDSMGFRVNRLSDFELYQLALFDVSGTFIREMKGLGYKGLSLEQLINMRIHRVKPETVRELRNLGYNVSADRLVEFQIHGVTPWFIEELADAGLKNLSAERLVEFRIHGVEADQLKEFRDLGLARLSADDLVKFRIHRVTPDFVRDLQKQGYRDLSPDRLVEFRIHSVSPSMIDELHELGYDDLTAEELTTFSIHGVTSDFIRDLKELGYDRVSPDNLVSMRIHGVTTSYIKRLAKRGYDDLTVEDLIDFRIHGID